MNPNISKWKSLPGSYDILNTRELFAGEELFGFPTLTAERYPLPNTIAGWPNVLSGADAIHFFTDDYRFERCWRNPNKYAARFRDQTILGFDFSCYVDWPLSLCIYSVYRSRYLGAFMRSRGVRVVPTVTWSDVRSFGFAFRGIDVGSQVSISSVGWQGADWYEAGFRELVERIAPSDVLVIGPELPASFGKKTNLVHYGSEQINGMRSRSLTAEEEFNNRQMTLNM